MEPNKKRFEIGQTVFGINKGMLGFDKNIYELEILEEKENPIADVAPESSLYIYRVKIIGVKKGNPKKISKDYMSIGSETGIEVLSNPIDHEEGFTEDCYIDPLILNEFLPESEQVW